MDDTQGNPQQSAGDAHREMIELLQAWIAQAREAGQAVAASSNGRQRVVMRRKRDGKFFRGEFKTFKWTRNPLKALWASRDYHANSHIGRPSGLAESDVDFWSLDSRLVASYLQR